MHLHQGRHVHPWRDPKPWYIFTKKHDTSAGTSWTTHLKIVINLPEKGFCRIKLEISQKKTLPNRFWSRIRQLLRLSFPGEVFVVIVACIKKDGSEAVQTHTPNIQNIETKHTWNPESQAQPILFSCQKFQVPYSNKILWVYGLIGARIHRELILPHPKESGIFALPNLLHILVASQQPGHSWLCSSAVSSFLLLEDCLLSALKPPLHEIPWDLPRTWR